MFDQRVLAYVFLKPSNLRAVSFTVKISSNPIPLGNAKHELKQRDAYSVRLLSMTVNEIMFEFCVEFTLLISKDTLNASDDKPRCDCCL